MLKVKQLEWILNKSRLESSNGFYSISLNYIINDPVKKIVAHNLVSNEVVCSLESEQRAKQVCQYNYSNFILSQIDITDFDPKLLGFDLLQDYEEETHYIKTTNVINDLGFTSAFRLHYIKQRDTWLLKFCKSAKVEQLVFPEVKIPNDYFGETLISQYLN